MAAGDNPNSRVVVKHNGAEITPDLGAKLLKVRVDHEINLPGMFQITFSLFDRLVGTWSELNLVRFNIGDAIEISMGLDVPQKVIEGEVVAIEPVFGDDAELVIRGFDKMHRLRYGKYRRSFLEMTDSEIVSKVVKDASLSAKVKKPTSAKHLYVFQNNVSNYRFLLDRAKRIGYELLCEGSDLIFRSSGEGEDPAIEMKYGLELYYFSVSMKGLTQGSTTEVRGWDVAKKEEISGKAMIGSANSNMKGMMDGYMYSSLIQDSDTAVVEFSAVDAADAEAMAKGMYNQMLLNFIVGEGECKGDPGVIAGVTVELKEIGIRFSGAYYVIKSTHIFDNENGYSTRFKVKRTGAT